jgi:hypothetical protein
MSDPSSALLVEAVSTHAFTRRSLLVAALAGTALGAAGCTADDGDAADAVTPEQVDQLAAQLRVQETLVAAYAQALAAAPDLATAATPLADQAAAQLDRLRAAAPGSTGTAAASSGTAAVVDAAGARAWLRGQVAAAADAHAAACPDFTGGRAALLGSIAAGLRGQDGQLA